MNVRKVYDFSFFYAANLTAAKEKGGLVAIFRP